MDLKKDVCIIGGGVMGLATAYYLSKEGKSTVLLEKKEIGAGASGACDDMILMQSKKPGFTLTLAMESLEIYHGLTEELGRDIGFDTRGGMILIEDENQLRVMEEFVKKQVACGLDVEIVGRDVMRKKQPHVAPYMIASTYSAGDSQIDPLLLMRAFLYNGKKHGLVALRNAPVEAIERAGDHWRVRAARDINVECDAVVIAAGAWSRQIGKLIDVDIPIEPLKGQIAITEQIAPIGETNAWSAAYIASKLDASIMPDRSEYDKTIGLGFAFSQSISGNYLIGSTREHAGYDKSTALQAITTTVRQACRFFPIMNSVNIIRTVAGFRPASADGSPIVGSIDGRPGIFIAAGHEGDGIALSPITGRAVAEMICSKGDHRRFEQLNLRRFAEKQGHAK